MTRMQLRLLKRLAELKEGATVCPGRLSRDCGTTLSVAREEILDLARAGKIKLSQRGRPAIIAQLKGPFRVGRI